MRGDTYVLRGPVLPRRAARRSHALEMRPDPAFGTVARQDCDRQQLAPDVTFGFQVVTSYPSGEGRGGSGLTVAFHGDQLYESFDTERGECEDLDLFSAIDPDDAIFGLHADGENMEAIDRFAQFCRNAINGFDCVDLVQLHGQAA